MQSELFKHYLNDNEGEAEAKMAVTETFTGRQHCVLCILLSKKFQRVKGNLVIQLRERPLLGTTLFNTIRLSI